MNQAIFEKIYISYPRGETTMDIEAEFKPPFNILVEPIQKELAKINRMVRQNADTAASQIHAAKNRILNTFRYGLAACDEHTHIGFCPTPYFFTLESCNKAFLVGLLSINSKTVPRILRYRNLHRNASNINGSEPIDPDVTDQSLAEEVVAFSYKQEQHPLTDDEIRKVVERYSAGASTYELATEFGCHRSTISRALKKSGIEVSHKASSREALTEKVLKMYADYNRPVDIGKALGINVSTVRKILHENDVHIRHSSEYPKISS